MRQICLTKLNLLYIKMFAALIQNDGRIMSAAYVTSKGQLVVPSRIRRLFGIKPGTRVNFIEEDGRIIFQPVTREYVRGFRGMFLDRLGALLDSLVKESPYRTHLEQ